MGTWLAYSRTLIIIIRKHLPLTVATAMGAINP
jgi:hypothetical protein